MHMYIFCIARFYRAGKQIAHEACGNMRQRIGVIKPGQSLISDEFIACLTYSIVNYL